MGKIIFTADDYGACDYIDSGIEIAVRERRINSVAAFTCFPDSHERIEKLVKMRRDEGLNFSIGLHFSVTAGFPLTVAKTLRADSNDLKSSFKLPEDFFDKKNKYDRSEIVAELNAQVQFMEAVLHDAGYDDVTRTIDSVSNHHGVVYIDNRLFSDYAEVIDNYGIPIRSPMPWSKSKKLKTMNIDRSILTPAIREGVGLGFTKKIFTAAAPGTRVRLAKEKGMKFPYVLLDEFYGQPNQTYLEFLIDQHTGRNVTSEFMFHLGDRFKRNTTDPDLLPGINFAYFDYRDEELTQLLATPVPTLLQNKGIMACSFRELDESDSMEPS